ncbi:uncharacterized protein LOC120423080 [Culex pipiens pallens]|uniref:uncharacterized protein LOC120423080 n=1 Tax=Culex pipiens pallens TaxID=42434 RepID=UPI0022AAC9FB|nr:uncharacterized protein LOC120423080 [Culex pipiens pallens]
MKTSPTKSAQQRQYTCRGTWMFTERIYFSQVSCRCICLALARLDTAAPKKAFKLQTDRYCLAIMMHQYTTRRKHQPKTSRRTWTSPAQLILSQKSFLLHTDRNPLTPTLLLRRTATYSSTTSTARKKKQISSTARHLPSDMYIPSAADPSTGKLQKQMYMSSPSTPRYCRHPQEVIPTAHRLQPVDSNATSLSTCNLLLDDQHCTKKKYVSSTARHLPSDMYIPSAADPFTDDPVIPTTLKLTSSLELMAHRSISRQHLGSHRTPNVKYNTSNQVSDKQYQLTHKSTRRAKPREEYGDCDRHSVQLNFDYLLLNKRFSERVIHPNLQWIF